MGRHVEELASEFAALPTAPSQEPMALQRKWLKSAYDMAFGKWGVLGLNQRPLACRAFDPERCAGRGKCR